MRILLAMICLLLLAFCVFGFAATFEPLDRSTQITWRTVYGVGGAVTIAVLGWLLVSGRKPSD